MNRLNIVSTHSNTAQLIRLEATRMGFLTTVSDTPIDGFSAYAVDCDTCPLLPPSPDAPLLLLSREEPPEQHAARATVLLPLPLALDELRAALAELDDEEKCGIVLRAKGIVDSVDGQWFHFDYTPCEIEIRRGGAGVTGRLCVIGSKLREDVVAALFA